MRALAALGKVDGVPTDPTSLPARHAIEKAERQYGLLADGIADQALLDRLIGEFDANAPITDATGVWDRFLDDGLKLSQIASALSAVLFGYLGLRRKI
ncbi:MAG: peptidoglycan-binding protein [Rhizobiales bacterium]|nr:peptidoglycan-binding protein [Hyphomicrobiales bacterium]